MQKEDKEEILDKAWESMIEYIKTAVREHLNKDDIGQEIWNAVRIGTKEFLGEMNDDLFEKFMSNVFKEKFQDLEITFKMRKE